MHTIVLTLCNYFYKSPDIVSIYLLIAGGTVHHQRHAQKTVQQVQFYTSSYFHIRAAFWQNVNVCICRNSLPRSNGNYSVISQIKPNKLHVKKGEISTVDPWDSLGLICYDTWSVSSWAAAVRKMIVMKVERLPEKRGTGDRNYSWQSVTQQTCYTPAKDLLNPEAWRVLCLH